MLNPNVAASFKELMQLMVKSIKSYAAFNRAAKGKPAADEATVESLRVVAHADRAAFDKRLREVLGNPTSPEGRENSKSWNINVQQAFVFGLVPDSAFRYLDTNGAHAMVLMNTAGAYVRGHVAIGKPIKYGVNRRSVAELRVDLVSGLATAETELDLIKRKAIMVALADLDRDAKSLLEEKPVSASTPQTPTTAAASIGEQVGSAVVSAVTSGETAPRTPRRGRQAQSR